MFATWRVASTRAGWDDEEQPWGAGVQEEHHDGLQGQPSYASSSLSLLYSFHWLHPHHPSYPYHAQNHHICCSRGPLRSETEMGKGHRHFMPSLQRQVSHNFMVSHISRLPSKLLLKGILKLLLQKAHSGRGNWSSQKSAGEVGEWEEHSHLHLATFSQVTPSRSW